MNTTTMVILFIIHSIIGVLHLAFILHSAFIFDVRDSIGPKTKRHLILSIALGGPLCWVAYVLYLFAGLCYKYSDFIFNLDREKCGKLTLILAGIFTPLVVKNLTEKQICEIKAIVERFSYDLYSDRHEEEQIQYEKIKTKFKKNIVNVDVIGGY